MLHFAGILGGNLPDLPQRGQPLTEQLMPFQNIVSDLRTLREQFNPAVPVHGDAIVFAQEPHGSADAGL